MMKLKKDNKINIEFKLIFSFLAPTGAQEMPIFVCSFGENLNRAYNIHHQTDHFLQFNFPSWEMSHFFNPSLNILNGYKYIHENHINTVSELLRTRKS